MTDDTQFSATGPLWLWRSSKPDVTAAWHFFTVDGQTSAEIRYATLGRSGGFGSVKVVARIGETLWRTSLFPSKEVGGYMLPIKADVRKREGLAAGDVITVELQV